MQKYLLVILFYSIYYPSMQAALLKQKNEAVFDKLCAFKITLTMTLVLA